MHIEYPLELNDNESEELEARRRAFLAGMEALRAVVDAEEPMPDPTEAP